MQKQNAALTRTRKEEEEGGGGEQGEGDNFEKNHGRSVTKSTQHYHHTQVTGKPQEEHDTGRVLVQVEHDQESRQVHWT